MAWLSKQASKQAHTYKQSVSSDQASKRTTNATLQYCSTAVGTKPATADPPYACIRPASARCRPRIVPMQTGLSSGATFYNGNSHPYSDPHFAPNRIFCPRLRRRETFTRFHTEADFEKESRSQNSAPTPACGVCVRAFVRRGQDLPKS